MKQVVDSKGRDRLEGEDAMAKYGTHTYPNAKPTLINRELARKVAKTRVEAGWDAIVKAFARYSPSEVHRDEAERAVRISIQSQNIKTNMDHYLVWSTHPEGIAYHIYTRRLYLYKKQTGQDWALLHGTGCPPNRHVPSSNTTI